MTDRNDRQDESRDWSDGSRATHTGIGTPDVDTGNPETMGKDDGGARLENDDAAGADAATPGTPGHERGGGGA